jgi:SAM-dependent methyltransferase
MGLRRLVQPTITTQVFKRLTAEAVLRMQLFTSLQYRLLRRIAPREPQHMTGEAYRGKSKLAVLLGADVLRQVAGRTVIDFGCGAGETAIELAQHGARVYGIDIQESLLDEARERAVVAGVADRCTFSVRADEPADLVVSIDAFEHFADPQDLLHVMYGLLTPGGSLLASFGPTWYHPYGGHLFSVFPWAHLVFSEAALIKWRAHFRDDGARNFHEVAGGLNQMTVARFHRIVGASPFTVRRLELVPIRKLRWLHSRPTREFTTAIVRCELVREDRGAAHDAIGR